MRSVVLVLTLAALVTPLAAQTPPAPPQRPARAQARPRARPEARAPRPADIVIPFQRFVLNNGLTLLVHEDHKAPIVAVNIWYHVGSKNERPGRTGFAHLFEHLMFNGSEHFNDDFFQPFERIGATDQNGTTNEDRTNYFENVPTSALDVALWMESDRMGHLLGAIDRGRPGAARHPRTAPYPGRRAAKAQANLTLTLPGNWETMDAVQGSIEQLVTFGLDDHYYDSYAQRVRALKVADAVAAAQEAIRPDHLVGVIVGDRAKIEQGIRELNFGEIRFLDADGKPLAVAR